MIFSAWEKKATVGGLIKTTPELRVAIDAVANDLKGKYPCFFILYHGLDLWNEFKSKRNRGIQTGLS